MKSNENDIETNRLTPEEYAAVLDGFQLKKIILENCSVISDLRDVSVRTVKIAIDKSNEYDIKEDGSVEIYPKYDLRVHKGGIKRNLIEIKAGYRLIFSSTEEVTGSFIEIYKAVSLDFIIWPFFRELVHSMTSRMNIPPLALPFIKQRS